MARFGETHDAFSNVNAVADDVGMSADAGRQLDRPKVNADADSVATHVANRPSGRAFRCYASDAFAHEHCDIKRVFGVAEKTDCHAITGIENDTVGNGDIADRLQQYVIEFVLDGHLPGNRLTRVADQVHRHNTQNECSVGAVSRHALTTVVLANR